MSLTLEILIAKYFVMMDEPASPDGFPYSPGEGLRAGAKHMQPTSSAPSSVLARPPPANTDNTYLVLWAAGGWERVGAGGEAKRDCKVRAERLCLL